MMKALPEYPQDIDSEIMVIAIDAMRGNFPDPHKAVHALYYLEGYALGQIYNDATGSFDTSKKHNMTALPPSTWLKIFQSIFQAFQVLLPLLEKQQP